MTPDPDCIFCRIIAGIIPGIAVWQNDDFIAYLDIFPIRRGQVIVIPKEHHPSSIFSLPEEVYMGLASAAKQVAMLLEERLGAERTMVVGEGLEINHAHLKLYPRFHNEGGLVHSGPGADPDDLVELARLLT